MDTCNVAIIILGNNVVSIETDALPNYLKKILIPKSVLNIEKGAFQKCIRPSTIEYEGSQADWEKIFTPTYNEKLEYAKINYNSTTIDTTLSDLDYLIYDKNADNTITIFSCNTAAENINIPEEINGVPVTEISGGYHAYDGAFYHCNKLTTITIPNSIKKIGWFAFDQCSSLTDVYYTGTETEWNTIDMGGSHIPSDVNIHYNSIAPTPIPVTAVEIERTDTPDSAEYTFTVTPETAYENCHVYAAVYDVNSKLLALRRIPLEMTGDTSVSVNKSENDKLVKVFVWADTLQPIIESAKKFPLTN